MKLYEWKCMDNSCAPDIEHIPCVCWAPQHFAPAWCCLGKGCASPDEPLPRPIRCGPWEKTGEEREVADVKPEDRSA